MQDIILCRDHKFEKAWQNDQERCEVVHDCEMDKKNLFYYINLLECVNMLIIHSRKEDGLEVGELKGENELLGLGVSSCSSTGGMRWAKGLSRPGRKKVTRMGHSKILLRKIEHILLHRKGIIIVAEPPKRYLVEEFEIFKFGSTFLRLDHVWENYEFLSLGSSQLIHQIIYSRKWIFIFNRAPQGDTLGRMNCFSRKFWTIAISFKLTPSVPSREDNKRSVLSYSSASSGWARDVCLRLLRKIEHILLHRKGQLDRCIWKKIVYPQVTFLVSLFSTSVIFFSHFHWSLSTGLAPFTLPIPCSKIEPNLKCLEKFIQIYLLSLDLAQSSFIEILLSLLYSFVSQFQVEKSLKLLVLSGETFPLILWEMLSTILPKTSILNLYGSTEVSGDCTYFDCERMSLIVKDEMLTSVPVGLPMTNCDVILLGENGTANEGELYVGGSCISRGYYNESNAMSNAFTKLPQSYNFDDSVNACRGRLYFRTGDLVKQLPSGDFVFLGRKDRIIKVNGQRIALEEIEDLLREHPYINDAAVVCRNNQAELMLLEAFIILKKKERSGELLIPTIKSWMINKLPSVMLPNRFIFMESFPVSSSGKVNYELLVGSALLTKNVKDKVGNIDCSNLLNLIKKAFHDALMVQKVSNDDDFFAMGGNSLSAAHVAYSLGIDLRFLYYYPSPFKLCMALLKKRGSCSLHNGLDICFQIKTNRQDDISIDHDENPSTLESRMISEDNDDDSFPSKRSKRDSEDVISWNDVSFPWHSPSPLSFSFSRCNKVLHIGQPAVIDMHQITWSANVPRGSRGHMKDFWKVYMESCVDASPLLVFKGAEVYLFIGSHSRKFLCLNARSGSVQWEIQLEGRIECTAAIVCDFSQVVVGCYMGKIYFLNFLNGHICWIFQTSGEVKSQPVVDTCRQLIWCGSHDHNLYALDYKKHCCVYKLPCGGSIYGSPAIDEVCGLLYVASTSGRITAISLLASPFNILWLHEFEVPVFASLAVTDNGTGMYLICCLVDGHVLALDPNGSIVWKKRTDGPIFAGPCIPSVLPHEEEGDLQWEYNVGHPITASACVDEHLQLESDASHSSDRLICICSSSGGIHLLRVNNNLSEDANQQSRDVQEFARLHLPRDIFSSPLMIGGRIFVGCRDDYLHCISLEIPKQHES
ncbi:hypothetical protein Fmac_011869 [Flemingia macrophylla]|uniref:Acyl-activating enzyme 19 n=1 Tax=Flemingia macrophylla TaxID=520843 RepID=A0ABD1MNM9_9FABA